MLLLKYDNTKKKRVEETQLELDTGNSKEYKVETIHDNAIYAKKSKPGHLPRLYYLVI